MSADTSRERLPVELVDDAGIAVGSCSVAEAHTAPGRRHRAFSVVLNDGAGRVLLQQRAAGKTRFPNRWSNTCCGHQEPGQDTAEAALARLIDELGITPGQLTPLAEAGAFHYHATDPGTGRVEDEWDHVLVATLAAGVPAPAAAEVSDCRWTDTAVLRAALRADPDGYTPWLTRVLDIAERSTTYDR
jgi:isopentenyl-diphosphate delta-isomerase